MCASNGFGRLGADECGWRLVDTFRRMHRFALLEFELTFMYRRCAGGALLLYKVLGGSTETVEDRQGHVFGRRRRACTIS